MRHLCHLTLLAFLFPLLVQAQVGDGRIYVNRIVFLGTENIDDKVLRQEMRQFEGTHINTVALEESRQRLERLPFVERAQVKHQPVIDAPDQVDILITITEAPARHYGMGGSYSDAQRLSASGFYVDQNLLGTGQRLFTQFEAGDFFKSAEISHTEPYATTSGVSRTVALSWRNFDQLAVDSTRLDGDRLSARLLYAYPVTPWQSLRIGIGFQDVELTIGSEASSQLESWVRNNGNASVQGLQSKTDYRLGELLFGWQYDTRDKKLFATKGLEQKFSLRGALPGSDIQYYVLDYEIKKYWPLGRGWTVKNSTRLGFGESYGSGTSSLAPNLNWFAGGPDTVRGYREDGLGPRDSLGNPYGGNVLIANQLELMLPLPAKWQRHTRIGLFYDIGNVYSTEGLRFIDDNGQALDYSVDLSELRHSAGIAAQFLLPFGALRLSYGVPVNSEKNNPDRFLRDDIDRFQIAIGIGF